MRERKQTRLKNYDYSQHGYYFVTICAQNREQWFGKVEKGEMILNPYGKIVNECWDDLPEHYAHCSLDSLVIMPNHVHGIIVIDNDKTVGNGLKPFPTHFNLEHDRYWKEIYSSFREPFMNSGLQRRVKSDSSI
jgi:hypothetical protein